MPRLTHVIQRRLGYALLLRVLAEMANRINELATIDGPVGVSKYKEIKRPAATEMPPITDARTAICSGVLLNERAEDAGIIRSAATNRIPITFIAIATVTAIHNIRSIFIFSTGTPSARARSS